MGKTLNARGKFGRSNPSEDRSKHWKHGKSSGDGSHQAKKEKRLAKRGK